MADLSDCGVVLVHGGMNTSRCWDQVLGFLRSPAIAIDLPGRGSYPADLTVVTLDDCVQAVLDAADAAGWAQFTLVGHSLGGLTVMETAARYPERVARLIGIAAVVPAPGKTAAGTHRGGPHDTTAGPVTIAEQLARVLFGTGLGDHDWSRAWDGFVPEAAGIINATLSAYPDRVPITYLAMTEDALVPPSLADEMVAHLGPNVTRRTLSGGHMVIVSNPRDVAALIDEVAGSWCRAGRTEGTAGDTERRRHRGAGGALGIDGD